MNKLGIEASIRHVPELDPKYFPILRFNQAFLKTAKKPDHCGGAGPGPGGGVPHLHPRHR